MSFTAPLLLLALLTLPLLWWLLRTTPPKPQHTLFAPLKLLKNLKKSKESASKTPLWLIFLRMALISCLILAMSRPSWQNKNRLPSDQSAKMIILIDNSWASAPYWHLITHNAGIFLSKAKHKNKQIALLTTTQSDKTPLRFDNAENAQEKLNRLEPIAEKSDFKQSLIKITSAMKKAESQLYIFSNGTDLMALYKAINISKIKDKTTLLKPQHQHLATLYKDISPADFTLHHQNVKQEKHYIIKIFDLKNQLIDQIQTTLKKNEPKAKIKPNIPQSILKDAAYAKIDQQNHAGATLLFNASKRKPYILILDTKRKSSQQPLLNPAHYIEKASTPYAQITQQHINELLQKPERLNDRKITHIALLNTPLLSATLQTHLEKWVKKGGILIRFASDAFQPNLKTSSLKQTLYTVPLSWNTRSLGGALSWDKPQKLKPFKENTPFSNIKISQEIRIKKQILPQAGGLLTKNIWASLEDNTPFITHKKLEKGHIIFFHSALEQNWSNFHLTGTFEALMERLINLKTEAIHLKDKTNSPKNIALTPLKQLNANGFLQAINNKTPTLTQGALKPGLYGTPSAFYSHHFIDEAYVNEAFALPSSIALSEVKTYQENHAYPLHLWFLWAAFLLALIDTIYMMWLNTHKISPVIKKTTLSFIVFSLLFFYPLKTNQAHALNPLDFTKKIALAYVKTGDQKTDFYSQKGLNGLTYELRARTSFIASPPVGISIQEDDLSFFPLLYWPMIDTPTTLNEATRRKLDAYMKQGGTVLFDTRDADDLSALLPSSDILQINKRASKRTQNLRALLSGLNIPPLEIVPNTHVLTKSFYLLENFTGRTQKGALWTQQRNSPDEKSAHDNISPLLITSNAMAEAWAINEYGEPLLPTIPPDPFAREWAYRSGINIVLYAMTGQYKADQVHVPTLLERLKPQ